MTIDSGPSRSGEVRPQRIVVAGLAMGADASGEAPEEDVLVRRARALRDAGVEVIWAGSALSAEQVAAIAVSEDADGVEVTPAPAVPDVARILTEWGAGDVTVAAAVQ